MTVNPWIPFGTTAEELPELYVLREGAPRELREPLVDWIRSILYETGYFRSDVLLAAQSVFSIHLGVSGTQRANDSEIFGSIRKLPDLKLLQVIDFMLFSFADADKMRKLRTILANARSYAAIEDAPEPGKWRLVERVPKGVKLAVDDAIQSSGDAGQQLAKAWSYIHQLDPKPSEAMTWAVRAVETAAIPVLVPESARAKATLGSVIRALKSDQSHGLTLRTKLDGSLDHNAMLLAMVETLWVGHEDRHGGETTEVNLHQARTSVYLAATLVAWFTTGCVT